MKNILLFTAFLLTVQVTEAQKPSLALNEHNIYLYYEVVDLPGISADSLKKNAAGFVASSYPKNNTWKLSDTAISVKDKFLTYTSFTKRESGVITYSLNIECKDAKYRYWISDFIFTPYQRDRYGSFVPAPGVYIPLETAKSKLDKRELEGYLAQTNMYCTQLAEKLKRYILTGHSPQKINKQPTKIVTDKW